MIKQTKGMKSTLLPLCFRSHTIDDGGDDDELEFARAKILRLASTRVGS